MSPPTTLPQTYNHPSPLASLSAHLLPHLPYSLPLLRRLQHHTSTSPTAHVFATFPPDDTPAPRIDPRTGKPRFAALFVDRARAPETQCWVFSSWESEAVALQSRKTFYKKDVGFGARREENATPSASKDDGKEGEEEVEKGEEEEEARQQLLALFSTVANLPPSLPTSSGEDNNSHSQNDLLLLGTLHPTLLPLLAGQDLKYLQSHPQAILSRDISALRRELATARSSSTTPTTKTKTKTKTTSTSARPGILVGISTEYTKFLIPPPSRSSPPSSVPEGYTLHHPLPPSALPAVLHNTNIPRTVNALASLGSICVRYNPSSLSSPSLTGDREEDGGGGEIVGHAFLSTDGSLSTLYTAPGHRGRGLAGVMCRALAQRLLEDPGGVGFRALEKEGDGEGEGEGEMGEKERGWMTSDVVEGNEASAAVARGLGGKRGWSVRWVGVDLSSLRQ